MGKYYLSWNDVKAKDIAKKAAAYALERCAFDLQGKSQQQAPIDTGDLRANCSVSPLKVEGSRLEVRVGYDLPYAIVQHERLDFKHPKGGGPKYLENPFNENKGKYQAYIEKVVKDTLRASD